MPGDNLHIGHSHVRGHLLYAPYWGCATLKGNFLSPDSLAKGVFGPIAFSDLYQ